MSKRNRITICLIIGLVAASIMGFVSLSQADDPQKFDLGDTYLYVDQIEYYPGPAYNEAPDVVMLQASLVNKDGEDVAFKPSGEITFIGASGKQWLFPNTDPEKSERAPFDLKCLQGQQERVQELAKRGIANDRELLSAGQFRWGFGTQIDRGEKIISMIFSKDGVTKTIDLSDVKVIRHEQPTAPSPEQKQIQTDNELDRTGQVTD